LAGGGLRQATGTFSRRRPNSQIIEGAPYRAQDLVANRYLIKDIVGAGPLGFVFRAHDKEVDVEVALKVIHSRLCQTAEERKAFAAQLRSARKLSHPNLVRVYEEGEDQDRPFFTSQFLDGLTLRKIIDLRLQKGQFFALHEVEPIMGQVCAAIDGAHRVGPHSDLKPDNVLVLPDLLKVTDFGVGLALPRLPFVQAMKSRKADRYLAPEMIEGGEVDGRCDVYSIGVIIGEMLSGLTPDAAVPELTKRNPSLPQALEGLYRKAINTNPNARFKTAGELFEELTSVAKQAAASAPPKPETQGPPPLRPKAQTGMLQLQPRRERPGPPVPPLPPSSFPGEGPADATQPIDSEQLAAALRGAGPIPASVIGSAASDNPENREETAVLDSAKIIAALDSDPDDNAETKALVATIPPASLGTSTARNWLPAVLVVLLVAIGLAVGAGGGFFLIQRQRNAHATPDAPKPPAGTPAVGSAAQEPAVVDSPAPQPAEVVASPGRNPSNGAEKTPTVPSHPQPTPTQPRESTGGGAAAEKNAADATALDRKAKEDAAKSASRPIEKPVQVTGERAVAAKSVESKPAETPAVNPNSADKSPIDKASDKPTSTGAPKTEPCPEGMRSVAAGSFRMGTARDDPMLGFDEKALSSIDVPAFCIDTYEYPNKKGVGPTVAVAFADAKRLCESQNKRLCSEAEWEKACKGPGGARWPFGNTFDPSSCNTQDETGDERSIAPAGRFAKCRSGYGVGDLAGNASEWTSERVIKGGSFSSADHGVRCAARKNGVSMSKSAELGFRCCADVKQ
jgi:serine/threonine protein kinase/formylglycine-generating enzyme required for sulfatase activity